MPFFLLAFLVVTPLAAGAVELAELDPAEHVVGEVEFTGNEAFWDRTLAGKLRTRERAWWAPWRDRPAFDPISFEQDLERLRRFYESEGYYRVEISHRLTVEEKRVDVEIRIDEGELVVVGDVTVGVRDAPAEGVDLPDELPLGRGEPFREEAYVENETVLERFFLERSYAQVEVERGATVDVRTNEAELRYLATRGPESVFGTMHLEGLDDVEPYLVEREIEWARGDVFSLGEIHDTRENLLGLGLFSLVKIGWEPAPEDPTVADMIVRVEEQPPRRIRAGIGYGTEDELRGQVDWSHFNWLGGGRQLTAALKLSTITRAFRTELRQPHFLTRRTTGILELSQSQDDEDTYDLLATRFLPRVEHGLTKTLTAVVGYRLAFASVSDVDEETEAVLGDVERDALAAGPSLGLVWNTRDDFLDPGSGRLFSVHFDHAGPPLGGGGYEFWRLRGEARQYASLGAGVILALRFEVGVADSLGGREDFPVFDRYFAGGETSVRGYGRRRLGPKSASDRPLGGLSIAEGSVELRRQIWGALGGVTFLDFGQVSLERFDVPVDDLEFSAGPGISYATPVGPIALFVGFPFDPPAGDAAWQLHFSIGQFF